MEPNQPASAPKRWRVSLPVSLGVVLLLASVVIAARSIRSHAGDSPTYTAPAAKPAEDARWMSLGYVDIEGGVTPLYPLQLGRIKSIDVAENEEVKAGAPLFHLEDSVQALKVQQARDALEVARQKLVAAQAAVQQLNLKIEAQREGIEVTRADLDRAKSNRDREKSFESKVERQGSEQSSQTVKDLDYLVKKAESGVRAEEKKLAALEAGRPEAEAAVKGARLEIDAKKAQVEEAENAVKECVLRAPTDGTPLRILVNVGQALGATPRQPAIQFAPKRPLLVRAEVEQEFVGRVRKGQPVLIEDHVTGQNCAKGKVVSLAQWYATRRSSTPEVLQVSNDARTLECIIHLDAITQDLRIGQRVRVQFPASDQ
jgi:multidrug resistance efflux pump